MMKIYDITDNHIFSNTNNLVIDRVLFFDNAGTLISRSESITSAVIQSSIIPNNTTFIKLIIRKSDFGTVTPSDLVNAQLEQGSSATTYEPYHTPVSYQLSLGDRKVFEGDYFWIDKTTGKKYHHHKMGNVIYTGASDENWSLNFNSSMFRIPADVKNISGGSVTPNILSNYYPKHAYTPMYESQVDYGIAPGTTGNDYIYIRNKDISSVADFKTWLSTHNTEAVYELKTETDEEITGTLAEQLEAWYNAQSIKGTTIIEGEGDLPMIIKCRALKGE